MEVTVRTAQNVPAIYGKIAHFDNNGFFHCEYGMCTACTAYKWLVYACRCILSPLEGKYF